MQYASEPHLQLVVIAREWAKEPATKTETDILRHLLAAFFGDEFDQTLLIANQGGIYGGSDGKLYEDPSKIEATPLPVAELRHAAESFGVSPPLICNPEAYSGIAKDVYLDGFGVTKISLEEWCAERGINLPEFWFGRRTDAPQDETATTDGQGHPTETKVAALAHSEKAARIKALYEDAASRYDGKPLSVSTRQLVRDIVLAWPAKNEGDPTKPYGFAESTCRQIINGSLSSAKKCGYTGLANYLDKNRPA